MFSTDLSLDALFGIVETVLEERKRRSLPPLVFLLDDISEPLRLKETETLSRQLCLWLLELDKDGYASVKFMSSDSRLRLIMRKCKFCSFIVALFVMSRCWILFFVSTHLCCSVWFLTWWGSVFCSGPSGSVGGGRRWVSCSDNRSQRCAGQTHCRGPRRSHGHHCAGRSTVPDSCRGH
jgi:hypothetical protein